MTPHDELMALAGKWAEQSENAYTEPRREAFEECAADLRALLDSDAFRAMVRDAERYRWLRANCENVADCYGTAGQLYFGTYSAGSLDAAIDAAASGAGEGEP